MSPAATPASPRGITAQLDSKSFASVQAGEISLSLSFRQPSSSFSYRLERKQGRQWKKLRNIKRRGHFAGERRMTVRKLFGRRAVKAGRYRLELASGKSRLLLGFKVFRGRPVSGAVSVSAGGVFTCAIGAKRNVDCWGANREGELGNGTTTASVTPVAVSGIYTASVLNIGHKHACALLESGTVNCWGDNSSATFGDGTHSNSSTPVPIPGLTNVVQIGGGVAHTCAVVAGAKLYCWGDNEAGQLGIGTVNRLEPYSLTTPMPVEGLSGVITVTGGFLHTCALIAGGSISCWGYNQDGQVGNGTIIRWPWPHAVPSPVKVSGIDDALSVSAGYFHTCALRPNGQVYCWGYVTAGDYDTLFESAVPVRIEGIDNAIAIASGGNHTCALISGGTVKCWGSNLFGELGNGKRTDSWRPVTVSGIKNAIQIGSGGAHGCAVLAGGRVKCWGSNDQGELGRGALGASTTPITVVLGSAR